MRIAISATGPSLDDEVDPRFGRCQYFLVVDPETMGFEAVDNSSMMAGSGAGISAAQMIANKGAQVLLTGNCGPNAYQTLSAAGVQVITGVVGVIRDAVQGYKSGQFQVSTQPSVGAHSGMGGGMGRGMGGGMGARMMPMTGPPPQAMSLEQEVESLKGQIDVVKRQLGEIQRSIEALGKSK